METLTKETFKLEPLPYPASSLEPYIDQKTMEIHHDKHHGTYINNLNNALAEANIEIEEKDIEDLIRNISKYSTAVRNNAGGHYNHTLFWDALSEKSKKEPEGKLSEAIKDKFGSFLDFKKQFEKEGMSRFGSGWVWLVSDNGNIKIGSTPNQDNPLMDIAEFKGTPLLGVDVWEHAYYLKYQNKRAEYLSNVWNVINWDEVEKRYEVAL